ncbi:aldose 1-epimerase family protein [Microbacterium limosum]|uniref:Aldose 1-epimerase family protein n=1 Tax=Microbacterium limosum TaxID=3079935 RepID=A0AAU0MI16_9MICO|nr:aldose 1-epimerase family protein [Microbacterium sp. Y20]WOQ69804.1 aldose 1-epimerase family protein [Microbacterium sp. Y20]
MTDSDDAGTDPTGRQHLLRTSDGRVSAQVAQVGASLRALRVAGVDLVPPYPAGSPTPAASGIVLAPWPNRVRDGVWTQRGVTRELALSERKFHNAAHGLLRFTSYEPVATTAGELTLGADIVPQTGYPFHLRTRVSYRLVPDGIAIAHEIVNLGGEDAPVALGAHPYLMLSTADTADLTLTSPGATRFVVDDRKLPVDEVPVDGSTDLREGRRVGDIEMDTAFGSLRRDEDGVARTTLTAPSGQTVTLWQGAGFDYVQIFTTDRYPGQPLAIAVEPMTAPADALNSGRSLRWLAPGEEWLLEWGITSGGL